MQIGRCEFDGCFAVRTDTAVNLPMRFALRVGVAYATPNLTPKDFVDAARRPWRRIEQNRSFQRHFIEGYGIRLDLRGSLAGRHPLRQIANPRY